MAALDFPSSPTIGQVYTANGKSWQWDGTAWVSYNRIISIGVTGSSMTIYGSPVNFPDATSLIFTNSISVSCPSVSFTGNTTLGDASGDTLTINAGTTTFAQGTANGVLYLNGSKVATSGSGLVFDGTNFATTGGISGTTGTFTGAVFVGSGGKGSAGSAAFIRANNGYSTASTPDYTFWYDDGTGVFHPASAQLGFAIGGSQDMTLTHKGLLVGYTSDSSLSGTGNAIFSGKVGIGTSSPGAKLDVTGSVNASGGYLFGSSANYLYESTTQSVTFRIGTSPAYLSLLSSSGIPIVDGAGGVLAFATGSTERMRIDSSGQCIWKPNGTTSAMTLNASGNLLIGDTNTWGGYGKVVVTANPTTQWGLDFTGSQVTIANGSNFTLPTGSGLVILNSRTYGDIAAYLVAGSGIYKLGGGANFVIGTTPAAGQISIGWTGSNYVVYSNRGATDVLGISMQRTRDAN